MREIFYLLDWLAFPLYILLGVVILWHLWRFFQARDEISASYFELERDLARQRQANAITIIVMAVEVCVLLLGVQLQAVPYLEAERSLDEQRSQLEEAPQDVPFMTDTAAPSSGGLDLPIGTPLGENADTIVLTPTLTPTAIGTIIPNAPPVQGCGDDRALLQIPTNGLRVFQPIIVRGTAHGEGFSQAKIEISGPSTNNQFVVIHTIIQPATEMTDYGQFVPAAYEEGEYEFRLVVFNVANEIMAYCVVTIYISLPPETATPTPTPQG
jgi:hypothetical protein